MSITETKLTIMNLIEMSKFRGHLGDSDGDFKLNLPEDIQHEVEPIFSLPVKYLGGGAELFPCDVNYQSTILLQAADGPDAWGELYIYDGKEYKLHARYSYDWYQVEEDIAYKALTDMEKVKFLYLKGLHLPE